MSLDLMMRGKNTALEGSPGYLISGDSELVLRDSSFIGYFHRLVAARTHATVIWQA